jgi:hypothetical protein
MIRRSILSLGLALGIGALAASSASAQGLGSIQGRWVEDRTGEPLVITSGGFGYETWLAWIGQAAIGSANGHQGSDIKIESADRANGQGIRCFYKVSITNLSERNRRMIWALRDGNSPRCPQAGVYSGVIGY